MADHSKIVGGSTAKRVRPASDGMYLRDYFAARAMQGMFAADSADSVIPTEDKARLAYEMADAMLKARAK